MGFLMVIIQAFLIGLKLTEVVAWSWWIIFTPLLVWLVFVLIVMAVLGLTVSRICNHRKAWR